jgi:hypothetical protein
MANSLARADYRDCNVTEAEIRSLASPREGMRHDTTAWRYRTAVSTPVDWHSGEDVIIVPSVSGAEARERFPKGWRALKPYLRLIPDPRGSAPRYEFDEDRLISTHNASEPATRGQGQGVADEHRPVGLLQ